jgi:carbamoyl-phosphate synthase small subunit
LRDKGAQSGAIVAGKLGDDIQVLGQKALQLAQSFPGMSGLDLAKVVTTKKAYPWREAEWELHGPDGKPAYRHLDQSKPLKKVVAYDFGVKSNILRMLAERGCDLTVVPAQTSAAEVFAMKPDGVFFSNGPGDPGPCDYAIAAAKEIIEKGVPTFGICLGHQIMGLAAGAKTLKMKFGHHGANHPVKDLDSGRVAITSQNHGFAVDPNTLPDTVRVTHISLFDGSLQGLAWKDKPALCFQGHPEASPGPHDIAYLFDRFVELMNASNKGGK